jgi:Inner membrane component of T3SS, cytoplasmic domain
MVRAFLFSFVMRQLLFEARDKVAQSYRGAWLVWEPGVWMAPDPLKQMTLVPPEAPDSHPAQGDALCFELALGAGQRGLRVGRAASCDVVINDATVSRAHLWLERDGAGWAATVLPSARGVACGGRSYLSGERIALVPGCQLKLGEVTLTYHDPAGFLARAEQEGARAIER